MESDAKKAEAKGTSFMSGSINKWGNVNYDLRDEINLKHNIKAHQEYDTRKRDHQLVENLANYDSMCLQKERIEKRMMTEQLNHELNADIVKHEAERKAAIDAKKNLRPQIYGDETTYH